MKTDYRQTTVPVFVWRADDTNMRPIRPPTKIRLWEQIKALKCIGCFLGRFMVTEREQQNCKNRRAWSMIVFSVDGAILCHHFTGGPEGMNALNVKAITIQTVLTRTIRMSPPAESHEICTEATCDSAHWAEAETFWWICISLEFTKGKQLETWSYLRKVLIAVVKSTENHNKMWAF